MSKPTKHKHARKAERNDFYHWIKRNKGLSNAYSHNLATAYYKSSSKSHKRALKLWNEYQNRPKPLKELEKPKKRIIVPVTPEILCETIDVLKNENTAVKSQNSLLEEEIADLKQQLKKEADTTEIDELLSEIASLKEEAKEREFFINEQAKKIAAYDEQFQRFDAREADLKSSIDNRRELVYITFTDESAKAYPSSLKFVDLRETIKQGQIASIAIIDVDWSL